MNIPIYEVDGYNIQCTFVLIESDSSWMTCGWNGQVLNLK